MSTTNNPQEPKLGYWFAQPESSHAPGGLRLDIFINQNPTKHHFDPEKLHLYVKSVEDSIESLTIRHPWRFAPTYQAIAGSIEMSDRYGKEEEAYIFGGSLQIETQDTLTICTLESPAPILEISSASPIMMMFIEEIEVLFAKRRAARLSQTNTYEKHLIKADPFTLYRACIIALIDKFEHSHHKEDLQISELLTFLHAEGERLKDAKSALLNAPTLEEIL